MRENEYNEKIFRLDQMRIDQDNVMEQIKLVNVTLAEKIEDHLQRIEKTNLTLKHAQKDIRHINKNKMNEIDFSTQMQQLQDDFRMLRRHVEYSEEEAGELSHYFFSFLPLQLQNNIFKIIGATQDSKTLQRMLDYQEQNYQDFQ